MDQKLANSIASIVKGFNAVHLFPQLVKPAVEAEKLILEISIITQTTPDEVGKFYQSHNYSLEFIKHATLLCGTLNKDEMENAIMRQLSPTPFSNLVRDIGEILPRPTMKEKILGIPYNITFYSIRPIAWIIRELWQGLRAGWLDIWEG